MASNKERARLCGWKFTPHYGWQYKLAGGWYPCPSYDTSLDACAELRAFVRARGETRTFVDALIKVLHDEWRSEDRDHRAGFTETRFDLIDATPAQQCAAFDATFKDELEKIQ